MNNKLNYYFLLICFFSWNCNNFNQANKNYESALNLYEIGDFNSSLTLLNAVISETDDSAMLAEAFYLRGKIYSNLFKYTESIESYDNALRYKYKNPSLIYNNKGYQLQEAGKFSASIEEFNLAISLDSSVPIYFNNRGFSQLKSLNYNSALNDFDKAIQLDSNYAGAFNNRGILFAILNDYESSLVNYNVAISLMPNYKEAIYGRATISILLNRYDDALYDLARVIEIDSCFGPAYYSAGKIFFKVENFDVACTQFINASKCGVLEADSIISKHCK